MDGVQAQSVDMEIRDPLQRVVDKVAAHFVAVSLFEIKGLAPGRLIHIGEIESEMREIVSFRTQVVVNHVQHDGHSLLMAGIHQPLQARRPAIGILHCERNTPSYPQFRFPGNCATGMISIAVMPRDSQCRNPRNNRVKSSFVV